MRLPIRVSDGPTTVKNLNSSAATSGALRLRDGKAVSRLPSFRTPLLPFPRQRPTHPGYRSPVLDTRHRRYALSPGPPASAFRPASKALRLRNQHPRQAQRFCLPSLSGRQSVASFVTAERNRIGELVRSLGKWLCRRDYPPHSDARTGKAISHLHGYVATSEKRSILDCWRNAATPRGPVRVSRNHCPPQSFTADYGDPEVLRQDNRIIRFPTSAPCRLIPSALPLSSSRLRKRKP